MALKENLHRRGSHVDFICGWAAGCFETILLYPQNKLVFRQQLYGISIREAARQLRREGLSLLYRGLLPPLMKRTTTRSIMFGMYEKYQEILGCTYEYDRSKRTSFTWCHAQAAFLSGATEAILTPFERVQTLLQCNKYHQHFKNTTEAFQTVAKFGFFEFFRGFHVILLRNSLSSVLFFTLRDPFKFLILDQFPTKKSSSKPHRESQNFLADFIAGAILGGAISTLFFPVNVVKTKIQADMGQKYENFFKVLRDVWRERNGSMKELFRGGQLNLIRSLLGLGITNATFEFLRRAWP